MTESVILALIRMSIRKGGSGVIIARTMARTPNGTTISRQLAAKPDGRLAAGAEAARAVFGVTLAGVAMLASPVHEFEDVGQHFGHGPVEVQGDFLADI